MTAIAVWLAAGNALTMVLGIVQSAVMARWMHVKGWGEAAPIFGLIWIADVVSQAGMNNIVAREIAKDPRRGGAVFGTTVRLRLALTAVAAAVVGVLAGVWAALMVLATVGQLGVAVLNAKQLKGPQVVGNLLPNLLSTGAIALCALAAPPSLDLALAALAVGRLGGGLGQLWLAREQLPVRLPWSGREARAVLKESWPLWIASFTVTLTYRLSTFLIPALLGKDQGDVANGYFQAAYKAVESGHALLGALVTAAFPVFSATIGRRGDTREGFAKAAGYARIAGVAAGIGAVLLGPWAVRVLYGAAYAPSGVAVQWLAPNLALTLLNSLLAALLTAGGRQVSLLVITVCMLAFNALANLIAIPAYGFAGAAAVTMLTEAFGLLLLFRSARAHGLA